MKAFKKNIFIFIFLLIGSYISLEQVDAASLSWAGVNVECIYEDGGAYLSNTTVRTTYENCNLSWIDRNGDSCLDDDGKITSSCNISIASEHRDKCNGLRPGDYIEVTSPRYNTNRMTYNLRGVSNQESSTTGNTEFVNEPFDVSDDASKCKKYLRRGYVTDVDEDDNKTTTTYYKFDNDKSDTKFEEDDFDGVSFWVALFSDQKTTDQKLEQIEENDETFDLVSERYILTDEAGEPNFTLTYIQESEQASGSNNYAYILVYDNATLLKTQAKTTILETNHFDGVSVTEEGHAIGLSDDDVIYLNNPEANSYLDSSSVTSYYYAIGQQRYTLTEELTATNTRKYVLYNVGLGDATEHNDELCDTIMPETSKVLKRVIQIAQIMIPVLLIGLIAFDVAKIVIAGNLEEELPKQKKKIMSRLIVAVIFFFLPLITTLIIDMIKETGFVNGEDIKSIECLFEP